MPSNKELATEAEALAAELGTKVDTEGLKNEQLTALIANLKETAKGRKKPAYYVAPRKAITTKRGILSGDDEDEIRAEDLPGGEKALRDFVDSGHVLRG